MPSPWSLSSWLAATPGPVEDVDAEMPRGAAEGEIPAIDEPRFGEGRWLRRDDELLAVEVEGEARAYPLRVLDYHEIVNDEIGGRPVAVTFCPLAGSGIAWERRTGEQALSFLVSGRLYRNDLVMKDRETGSLWPQLLGRALHGELEGTRLDPVPTWRTRWGWFRQNYPDSLVLDRPRHQPAVAYETRSHPGYQDTPETMFEPVHEDERMPRKRRVVGLARGEDALAIREWDLQETNLTIEEVDGEEAILGTPRGRTVAWWTGDRSFRIDDGGHLVGPEDERWDPYRGRKGEERLEPAPAISCYWFAWVDVHPETRLWHK